MSQAPRVAEAQDGARTPAPPTPGLETLVRGLFDYAGMFPPASLDLDGALKESARAPRLARPHIVAADIVVPYARLRDLTPARTAAAGFGQTTMSSCVVGVDTALMPNAVDGIAYHNRSHAPNVRVTALEVAGAAFDARGVAAARDALGKVRLFLEPQWPVAEWPKRQGALLAMLEDLKGTGAPVGLKVRAVGPTAIDAATLARLLPDVAALPVPLKATQGLHHPILEERHGNALGFLSLALALRLSQQQKLAVSDLKRLLAAKAASEFAFDDGASWRSLKVSEEALRLAMADLPFTIGSCSLREPDDDLVRLWGRFRKA